MEELLNKTGSVYKLVVLASKRAVELNAGAGKLVDNLDPKAKDSVIALEEIRQGKVKIRQDKKGAQKDKG